MEVNNSKKAEGDCMLAADELRALDDFRQEVLAGCEVAAASLVDKLKGVYPNMDVQEFLNYIDDTIDEFTYEAMTYNEDIYEDYNADDTSTSN